MSARLELAELAALLALEGTGDRGPHWIARDAATLMRLGKRAASIALRQCNGVWRNGRQQWDETDEEKAERARAKIKATAEELLKAYGGATVTVHGDPRGFTMRLHFPSGRKNGMGDGWGVA